MKPNPKTYYYIRVFQNEKPLYITSVNFEKRICRMKRNEFACPLGFRKSRELSLELRSKGIEAYIVVSETEYTLRND